MNVIDYVGALIIQLGYLFDILYRIDARGC